MRVVHGNLCIPLKWGGHTVTILPSLLQGPLSLFSFSNPSWPSPCTVNLLKPRYFSISYVKEFAPSQSLNKILPRTNTYKNMNMNMSMISKKLINNIDPRMRAFSTNSNNLNTQLGFFSGQPYLSRYYIQPRCCFSVKSKSQPEDAEEILQGHQQEEENKTGPPPVLTNESSSPKKKANKRRSLTSLIAPIKLTDRAVERIKEIIDSKPDEKKGNIAGIRIGVKRRGCNGLSYTMNYVETDNIPIKDEVVEKGGVKVWVDPLATMHIVGTEMDYEETELASEFTFNNPNAKGECGCGESFNT